MTRSLTTALRLAFFPLAMLVLLAVPAAAAVSTWVGGGATSNFSEGANWDAPPTPNCDLVFAAGPAFAARGAPVNNLVGLTVNALNIYEAYNITGNAISCKIINNNNATIATVGLPLATAGAAALTITVTTLGATLNLTGIISGAGPVTYGGPGIKRLAGTANNTLTGTSTVAMGTLQLDSAGTEAIAGPLLINSGATATLMSAPEIKNTVTVTVNGTFSLATATGNDGTDTETIGGLLGTGTVALGANILGCTAQITPTTYSGGFSGAGNFRQSGSGTQVLSGISSTSTGATTLAGGSIRIRGNFATAPVAVTAGTLVLANDCIVGNVTLSGGAGSILSFNEAAMNMHGTTGNLTVGSGSVFQVVTKGAATTLYSRVTATAVNITGAVLTVNTATYTPALGAVMTIIDNTGVAAISGTFAGLASGDTVTSATNAGTTFLISYTGGTGNDVTLTTAMVAADSTAPTIATTTTGTPTSSTVTITWTTNEASDSQVEYGTTTAYDSMTTLNTSMVTSHSVAVSGLTASTVYHYRVLSSDASGNLVTGTDRTFTTTAGGVGGGGGGGLGSSSNNNDNGGLCGAGSAVALLGMALLMVGRARASKRD